MIYPIYLLLLAITPGLIWLIYFLKKDVHPEPRRMILKIFFLGMFSAFAAALAEKIFQSIVPANTLPLGSFGCYLFNFSCIIIGVAFVEEFLKYFVIRNSVMKSPELDEPMDIILYMIIAGLGFATLENIFIFFSPEIFSYGFRETISLAAFRFISATFLHALCSGTIGFFIALSFCEIKKKKMLLPIGFIAATLLHGVYNFSIINLKGALQILIPIVVLVVLAIFITLGIRKMRKLKGICKI